MAIIHPERRKQIVSEANYTSSRRKKVRKCIDPKTEKPAFGIIVQSNALTTTLFTQHGEVKVPTADVKDVTEVEYNLCPHDERALLAQFLLQPVPV